MLKHFLNLQWKSFFRAASFKTNLVLKIFMFFGAIYMIFVMIGSGIGTYYFIDEKIKMPVLEVINKFLVYWLIIDLAIRYFFQKMPVLNIKPLIHLPVKKNKIVNFTLGKTTLSFFNIYHAFYFIPLSVMMLTKGNLPFLNVMSWHIAIIGLIYCNNFINVLINNKDILFYSLITILLALAGLQYYHIFDFTIYTEPLFHLFYNNPATALIPILAAFILYFFSFKYFKKNLYLDEGLSTKKEDVTVEDLSWLDRFGSLSVFLKNDIKLIKRNKRAKTAVLMSILFIFYGFLFITGSIEAYEGPTWRIFAGLFVSGGFLFSFGQFVPSWDSSYYPLMMSQNIKYRDYLLSKWYLIVIATVVTTIIASFYLYFGWEAYAAILTGAIFNIGVNGYLVLLAGAYTRTPIDLTSNKNAFGNKQAFNLKTMLLTLPKIALPMIIYAIGHYTIGPAAGFILVALTGLFGLLFRNFFFNKIESLYKTEKYKAIAAYKEKN
ncbi:DUF5687 family protein [Abyssalbus ytuae]|uniref:DUF5687 family protein n=1 Tax=Abyssalbus ytuae TaxID=2926907 RepID=A0A9E6ZI94_9FLAO|nr:DUF5687 family protein [Abyssalbus ytuae]UOB16004.1 DUF5687 family protein [Abyssalbus ytuae]